MATSPPDGAHPASFRDPSGGVFHHGGQLYRRVNPSGARDYDLLMSSGLHARLVKEGLIVPHEEVSLSAPAAAGAHRILKPEVVPFVSYPYEWSFSQLKDAALATLRIQALALESGLSLKDASAFNLQFLPGRGPVLIDTLSFEAVRPGQPWVAYRQFCQHFLAPLALIAHVHPSAGRLSQPFLDGVPLDVAAAMLPRRTKWSLGLLTHLHLHAKAKPQATGAPDGATGQEKAGAKGLRVSDRGRQALLENLAGAVRGLEWKATGTPWADYYTATNYSDQAFAQKKAAVAEWLDRRKPRTVWDLGGNVGLFSRLASDRGAFTVSWDLDPAAVDVNYRRGRDERTPGLLPLVMDLSNPSPALGWHHRERHAMLQRGPADLSMSLALVHHLAIGNNVPLPRVADFLADAGRDAIVEFVPKEDSQVREMLSGREDVFPGYTQAGFEEAFARRFTLLERRPLAGGRVLYLWEGRA